MSNLKDQFSKYVGELVMDPDRTLEIACPVSQQIHDTAVEAGFGYPILHYIKAGKNEPVQEIDGIDFIRVNISQDDESIAQDKWRIDSFDL